MKGERQKVGNEEYISPSGKGTLGGIKIVFFDTQEMEHVYVFWFWWCNVITGAYKRDTPESVFA